MCVDIIISGLDCISNANNLHTSMFKSLLAYHMFCSVNIYCPKNDCVRIPFNCCSPVLLPISRIHIYYKDKRIPQTVVTRMRRL